MDDGSFKIITSLRWVQNIKREPDGKHPADQAHCTEDAQLLPLHRDRMLKAARTFEWHEAARLLKGDSGLEMIRTKIDEHFNSQSNVPKGMVRIYKVRIVMSRDGGFALDSSIIGEVSQETFSRTKFISQTNLSHSSNSVKPPATVYIDSKSCRQSAFTTHKTTYRPHYDKARERRGISHDLPTKSEVLLWNDDEMVMETSLCTPYFRRNGKWITPTLSCGGNAGVTRRKALEIGLCGEADVRVDSLKNGEEIWLSNAVRGFFKGVISL